MSKRRPTSGLSTALDRAIAAHRQGDRAAALRWLKQHTAAHPKDERGWLWLAKLYWGGEQHGKAIQALQRVQRIERLPPDERLDLAALLLDKGDVTMARGVYHTLQEPHPSDDSSIGVEAALGLARCALHEQAADEALARLAPLQDNADHLTPQQRASLHFLAGSAHLMRQEWPQAARALGECLQIEPDHIHALNNLGVVLKDGLKDKAAAAQVFEKVLAINPHHLDSAVNLASIRMDGTDDELRQALALLLPWQPRRPAHILYWHALGQIRHRLRDWPEALEAYHNALQLSPDNPDVLTNLGLWHFDRKDYQRALESFETALQRTPNHPDAMNFLGVCLAHLGQLEQQLPVLERLVHKHPSEPSVRFQIAWNLLGTGQFELGFREYLFRPSRHNISAAPNGLGYATRLPERMDGDRLLLVADQGIGDEWFFLRFAPFLQQRGAALDYYTPSKIAPLIERLGWFDTVWRTLPPPDVHDAAINIGDLPYLVGMRDTEQPPPPIAIAPQPEAIEQARIILRLFGPPPYVAVTWQGGTNPLREKDGPRKRLLDKSIPIESIAQWLPRGATIVSLQRKPLPGEVSALAQAIERPVLDAAVFNDDLERMLGLLACLDHYYAVSNANVHLAASIGLPCTVFVPQPPEWRWLIAGERTPWFPNATIVRQRPSGAWPNPMEVGQPTSPAQSALP